ncbi:MAG: hypothetical protein PHN88_01100 [Ignavibacteria bacterium]|nr:hypothetical protein [Ignavibacteria bacterium]
MKKDILNNIKLYLDKTGSLISKIVNSDLLILFLLISVKILFQIIVYNSGYMWLSSDDYCRTVKSYEWLQKPVIYSGVWLSPHFWINGFLMIFIKDIYFAATFTNFIFSTLTVYYFFKICLLVFDRWNAVISTLIFIFFPFQVWLSISGLPESIHFFFIIGGIYYALMYKINNGKILTLFTAAVFFAFGNIFRYEGWLFSVVFIVYICYIELVLKKGKERNFTAAAISFLSLITIVWWLLQNLKDYGDILYFAKETNKIYEDFGTAKVFQKVVQYPIFIFYIAPITSFFAIKVTYDCILGFFKKKTDVTYLSIFVFLNLAQLILLMFQGLIGTGGTNMISRYIVINAILFIPLAVKQIFAFRKYVVAALFALILLGNIIWSFNYPHPFREDTYETGRLIRDRIEKNYVKSDDKVYFEEIEGYYDVFAVQTLANYPSKFVLGNFPTVTQKEIKGSRKKKSEPTVEELNILDIKSFLQKNKIALAVVKSDGYSEKLTKMNFKNEEIGDYKIFYIRDIESNISDSSITVLAKNTINLKENPKMINFGKFLAVKDFQVDNSNYGFNPQTITIDWASANRNILDSIDYEEYDFDRYLSVIEIRRESDDSLVYTEKRKIFSDRNIEDLLVKNEVRTITVLKPFALIYYSRKFTSPPFESGVYNLNLKVYDAKNGRNLKIFKGDSLYTVEDKINDTLKFKVADTLRTKAKQPDKVKLINPGSYTLGNIIAFFPNTNIEKVVTASGTDFYRIITRNGLQVFFSQRYQADHFLNFVFNYF